MGIFTIIVLGLIAAVIYMAVTGKQTHMIVYLMMLETVPTITVLYGDVCCCLTHLFKVNIDYSNVPIWDSSVT